MAGRNTQSVNIHTKKYIQAVFEESLRAAGFANLDERYLTWYRIVDDCVVNSVFFTSRWNMLPVELSIHYGIHPLFALPHVQRRVCMPDEPLDNERFMRQAIVEDHPVNGMHYGSYAPDVQVCAPGIAGRGLYAFNGLILPKMNSVHTVEDCYRLHKQYYLDQKEEYPDEMKRYIRTVLGRSDEEQRFCLISPTFVEEAIYTNDTSIFPAIMKILDERIANEIASCRGAAPDKAQQESLSLYVLLRNILADGRQEAYLPVLELRRKKNMKKLQSKLAHQQD